MSKKLVVMLVMVAFILGISGIANAKPVTLRYNLQKGDVVKYRIKMVSKTSLGYRDKIDEINTESHLAMTQRVIDKEAKTGIMYILTSVENVKTVVNGLPSNPAQQKAAEKVFTMHIKPSGEIVDAQGLNGDMSMQQMQLSFPKKPVDVGSVWEHTIPANDKIKVPLHMKYEVKGFKELKGHKCIVIKSTVVSKPKAKGGAPSSLDVKAEGKIYFDYETGQIVQNKVTGNFGSVSIQDIGGKPEPIVTKVVIELLMKLVK